MPKPDSHSDHRAHARRTVLVAGRILEGEEWRPCEIINVSAGGAKIRIDHQVSPGTVVRLEIGPFGHFNGTIAWQQGEEVGLKFSHDPAEMAEVVIGLAMYG